MNAKTNPLNQNVTGNPYYDYLIHEVQVVCNCPTDKAMAIVSYVNSLGSSPIEFIRKLPDYVGNPHPDADEVLQALENIREDHGRTEVRYLLPGRLRKPKGTTPPGKGST